MSQLSRGALITPDGRNLGAAQNLLAGLLRSRWTGEAVPDGSAIDAQDFLRVVKLHGVSGVLERRCETPLMRLAPHLAEALAKQRIGRVAAALSQAQVVLRVVRALEDAGIASLPLKGLTLSWLLYGDIAVRQSGDIDLLVDESQIQQAAALLGSMGLRPAAFLPRNGLQWREWMRTSHHLSFRGDKGAYLELHWRNDPLTSTSLPPLSRLLPRLTRIPQGPLQGLWRLPDDLLERSLATHACRSRCMRWKWGYDVLEMISARHGGALPLERRDTPAEDAYSSFVLHSMAAQLGMQANPDWRVGIASRAAAMERRLWLLGAKRSRTLLDGSWMHLGALAALDGRKARLQYLAWVASRVSPDVGDTAYLLVARWPWLAPAVRTIGSLKGRAR